MAVIARTWVTGELATSAKLNTLRDDLSDLNTRLVATNLDGFDVSKFLGGVFLPRRLNSGFITLKPIDGDDIVTSETTHYTCPNGANRASVSGITVCNTSSSDRKIEIHIVPSGSNRSISTTIFEDTIFAGEIIVVDGPFFLQSGDTIRSIGVGMSANQIGMRATVAEFPALVGAVLLRINGSTVGTSQATIYTCPNSKKAIVVNLVVLNAHDSSSRNAEIEIRPSSGSAQARQRIISGAVAPGEQLSIDNLLLKAGDSIHSKGSASNSIIVRPSIVELS